MQLVIKKGSFLSVFYRGGQVVGQKKSIKLAQHIYKASLKSTTNSDQHYPRDLATDHKTLQSIIIWLTKFFCFALLVGQFNHPHRRVGRVVKVLDQMGSARVGSNSIFVARILLFYYLAMGKFFFGGFKILF